MEEIEIKYLVDLKETIAKKIFENCTFGWEVLPKIGEFILELGNSLDQEKFNKIGENIWIAKTAKIAPTSCIIGPCIIDEKAEIRHAAFIRGNVIIGKEAVVRKCNRIEKCHIV